MQLHSNRHINFMLQLLYLLVIGALLYLGFKYLLRYFVPLIIAFVISAIIIRPVNWLGDKGVPRKVTAIIFTLLTVTLMGFLVYWLVSVIVIEATNLASALPQMVSGLMARLDTVQVAFDELFTHLPDAFQGSSAFDLQAWLSNLKLPEINVSGALSSAAGVASSLPGFLISLVFVFVATYFLTAQRAEIMDFLKRQLGEKLSEVLVDLKTFFFSSLFKWIKAQGILICITFVVLMIWFLILRQPYALLLSILIAIIDALPILGVGTVMIPWAIIDLLSGEFKHAILMILIYASVLIVRNSIEPKIVGTQLGIHPFVSLLCVYFGFRLAGFAGMFLLPMAVLCLIRLQENGRIHLWK